MIADEAVNMIIVLGNTEFRTGNCQNPEKLKILKRARRLKN